MNSERAALVRGSDPPPGHSVHNTAGDTWWVPARRLTEIFVHGCAENRPQKILMPLRWQKIYCFSGLGEECRTSRATSRHLDHGSTLYLRGRHLHSLASPNMKRGGRGLIQCRGRRSSCFDQRADNFQRESTGSAARSLMNKSNLKNKHFPRFFHRGSTSVSSAEICFELFGKKTLQHRVPIVIGLRWRSMIYRSFRLGTLEGTGFRPPTRAARYLTPKNGSQTTVWCSRVPNEPMAVGAFHQTKNAQSYQA